MSLITLKWNHYSFYGMGWVWTWYHLIFFNLSCSNSNTGQGINSVALEFTEFKEFTTILLCKCEVDELGKFRESSLCWAASPCQLSVAIMSRPGTFVLCLLGGATVAKLEFDVKTHYRRKYKQISLLYHQTIFGDIFIK